MASTTTTTTTEPSPRPMRRLTRLLGSLLIGLVYAGIVGAMLAGGFVPLDDAIRDLRFAAAPRSVSGDVVFVDIDAKSLESVGVWPWPRSVHADLLNRLMALGAGDVLFDIDFSVASSESQDAALEAALGDAGGYAHLAAFQQQKTGSKSADFNLPLARFGKLADPAVVNVSLDTGGVVRTYPFAMTIGTATLPSAAALLAGVKGPAGGGFDIDYSIDPGGIDRISAADVLNGKVAPARLAGKQVIIGASAVELRDFFVVPRFGALPGGMLQILATETLKQGRALQPAGTLPGLLVIGVLGLVALIARKRLPLAVAVGGALAVSLTAEALALVAQLQLGLLADTAPIHAAVVVLVVSVLGAELVERGRQRQQATRERDAVRLILDRVITDNFDGVIVANADGIIVSASTLAATMLGHDLPGRNANADLPEPFAQLLRAPGGQQGEMVFRHDGEDRTLEYVVTRSLVVLGQAPSNISCLTFRDVTERRAAETSLRFISGHDVLTGALRRTRLVELMSEAFAAGRDVAVMVIELRRFRLINDTLGHGQGDELLRQVASRLKSMGPDAVARLGGVSFALLVPGMSPERLQGFAETVTQWLAFPYELADGHQAIITANAGATTSLVSSCDAAMLLSHADMALSAAKKLGGNRAALFAPAMDERLKDSQTMDAALRQALLDEQFTLAYQPQVNIKTGEIVGVEALARWTHPTLGPISPGRFIPAAEETGLILDLGRWALRTACREAASWPKEISVAVNVSPVQFELSDVLADVTASLRESGLAPERLEIEITEGIFVRNFEAVTQKLSEIRKLGVSVALDDFGTGYSSLSYLGRLPIDKIKIDQSFTKRLPGDNEAAAIVRAVIALSETLGKRVIAEGVETADQAWLLNIAGCGLAQGYHFGRPMPAANLVGLLAPMATMAATG